jgi:hypothetical protein
LVVHIGDEMAPHIDNNDLVVGDIARSIGEAAETSGRATEPRQHGVAEQSWIAVKKLYCAIKVPGAREDGDPVLTVVLVVVTKKQGGPRPR